MTLPHKILFIEFLDQLRYELCEELSLLDLFRGEEKEKRLIADYKQITEERNQLLGESLSELQVETDNEIVSIACGLLQNRIGILNVTTS